MSSASRLPTPTRQPLSAVNRESALLRTTAAKIKRKSIGLSSAATAAKRARPLLSRPVTPTERAAAPAATARPASTSTMARPLSQSMVTGRTTIATTTSSTSRSLARPASQSALRPPVGYGTIRQRSANSTTAPAVDAEKEEMRIRIAEMEEKMAEKDQKNCELREKLEEKQRRLDEKQERLDAVKERLDETKEELDEKKSALREAREVNAELKGALKAEKEAHMKSNKQNAEFVEVLKREAINKDDAMRLLHNDVVDLRGRIRVSVRVRPLLAAEAGESTEHLSYPDQTTVAIEQQKGKVQPFGFNHVYGPNFSQVRIFDGCKDLILSVLHGYNVSIISYGQTGSGKTHTMRGGEDEAAGLIPRAVRFLFENRSRLEDLDWKFEFAASFLEVYNNDCYDLLSTPPRAKREIKQQNDKFVVDGLTVEAIDDVHKMATLLRKSDANRSTAATKCNETSSRSHAVFALSIKGVNGTTGAKIDCVLKLVDLAGSERAKETGAVGDRFTEMTHINTALSNLQTCIRAILTKQQHVPYRNSKLTTLLQDSLSGGSKCMVILSLSPQLTQMNESKRTLEFGRNLSQTHIGAAKKKET